MKTVTFAEEEVPKASAAEANTEADFLTQQEEELAGGEGEEQAGAGLFLTQAEADPFELFHDKELRHTIAHRHIVTVEDNEEGEEIIVPHHFFSEDSPVKIGSGLRDSEQCDVALSKLNREGKGMNAYQLSNMGLTITPVTDEHGQPALQATSSNSAPLIFWSALSNQTQVVKSGTTIPIQQGDEIRFWKGAPYKALRFVLPGWEPPEGPSSEGDKSQSCLKN